MNNKKPELHIYETKLHHCEHSKLHIIKLFVADIIPGDANEGYEKVGLNRVRYNNNDVASVNQLYIGFVRKNISNVYKASSSFSNPKVFLVSHDMIVSYSSTLLNNLL